MHRRPLPILRFNEIVEAFVQKDFLYKCWFTEGIVYEMLWRFW